MVNNRAILSGSSFMNVDNSSTSTTPVIDKIKKFEELLTSRQAILVDEAGNPLKKVEFLGDYDSEHEAASVDNDMARSMDSERVGFGTQSLLEQWRDSYGNGDYDEYPYDDDMYEGSKSFFSVGGHQEERIRAEERTEGREEVEKFSPHLQFDCYYSRINQGEVRTDLRKMKRNKVVGQNQIPIDVGGA
ncbi:hypothetical protein Tco_1266167 [Tanacetum coccineum]